MNLTPLTVSASAFFILLTARAAVWGFRFVKKDRPGWSLGERLAAAIIPPLALSTICLYGSKIIRSIGEERNWMRLVTTAAFFDGLPVYGTADSGAALATIYGPVSFLAYWPATFAGDPFWMVRLASLLSSLFLAVPLFLVIMNGSGPGKKQKVFAGLVFCIAASMPFVITSLKDVFFLVHADPSALGLISLAGGFLYLFRDRHIKTGFLLSALAYALGIWAKQVTLPVLLPLVVYTVFMHGFRQACFYGLLVILAVCALTAAVFLRFDPAVLYFNMVELPSSHALRALDINSVFHYLWKILRECSIPAALTGAGLAYAHYRKSNIRITKTSWSVYLWITLVMLPVTFYIHLKEGASNNTFAYSNYFFLTAAALMLTDFYGRNETRSFALNTALFISLILTAVMVPNVLYRTLQNTDYLNDARRAYAFNLRHPDQVYLPRMALMNYLVDGRLYHSVDGIRDRSWAGLPLSSSHFRADIPAKLKYIVFAKENYMNLIPLPEFARETRHEPGLEGLSVITTEDNR